MTLTRSFKAAFAKTLTGCLAHLSVDCVVFGFHDRTLKVLLLKWRSTNVWALPGGYVGHRESLDDAAHRVLCERTGLNRARLHQFSAFGGLDRRERASLRIFFGKMGLKPPPDAWPLQRVVSIGYYALVEHSKVTPRLDPFSDAFAWFPVRDLPTLAFDHAAIVRAGLQAVADHVDSPSTVAELLPGPFTMPELQRVHEAVLGRPLDRRNFQKRILDRGGLERLPERRTGASHRPPFLYRFTDDGSSRT